MGEAPILIRDAVPDDLEIIARFQETMALVTENKRLDPDRVRAGVSRALRDTNRGTYLIAEVGGATAGSLFVTREWSDWRNGWFWWIQSVFVSEAHRRRGVYRALHEAVRERARSAVDVVGIRLYVETENRTAQRTYEALGMQATSYLFFEEALGPDPMTPCAG